MLTVPSFMSLFVLMSQQILYHGLIPMVLSWDLDVIISLPLARLTLFEVMFTGRDGLSWPRGLDTNSPRTLTYTHKVWAPPRLRAPTACRALGTCPLSLAVIHHCLLELLLLVFFSSLYFCILKSRPERFHLSVHVLSPLILQSGLRVGYSSLSQQSLGEAGVHPGQTWTF